MSRSQFQCFGTAAEVGDVLQTSIIRIIDESPLLQILLVGAALSPMSGTHRSAVLLGS